MEENISRRDFLKIAGLGAAFSATLTGIGSVRRQANPTFGPGWSVDPLNEELTPVATTCGGCPAGCGLVLNIDRGSIQTMNGNQAHPRNRGDLCALSQSGLLRLYSEDRFRGPLRRNDSGGGYSPISWGSAIQVIAGAFQRYRPSEIAFLLSLFPDHLYDLTQLLSWGLGGASVLRYDALSEFESQVTLMDAAQSLFGVSTLPYFDVQGAAVTFSFGANFAETWLSPVQYKMGEPRPAGVGGYLVQFESLRSPIAASADEWIQIRPGSEASLVRALSYLVAEICNLSVGAALGNMERNAAVVNQAVYDSGVPLAELERLARLLTAAPAGLVLPGAGPLGYTNGLATAQAILALNVLLGSLGQPGGVCVLQDLPIRSNIVQRPNTLAELKALAERMHYGQIKALFVHGVNPVRDLPDHVEFTEALQQLELLVSFASSQDETAEQADFIMPDHTPLEAWGYQKLTGGVDRLAISGIQPVVPPQYDTRATVEVLLKAAHRVGGRLVEALPFRDEIDFLKRSLSELMDLDGVISSGSNAEVSVVDSGAAFWDRWLQNGGWWQASPSLIPAIAIAPLERMLRNSQPEFAGQGQGYDLYLLLSLTADVETGHVANCFSQPGVRNPGIDALANIQAVIHPQTAQAFGIEDGAPVRVCSTYGKIEAAAVLSVDILPGAVAIAPTHNGFLRPECNIEAISLLSQAENASGNWAYLGVMVKLEIVSASNSQA